MSQIFNASTLAASTPPVAVATANLFGWSLPDLVQLTTLAYLGLLILHKIMRMVKEWRSDQANAVAHEPKDDE